MIYIAINALPILLATLAGLAAGMLWLALSRAPVRWSPGMLVTAVVAQAWLCAILAGAVILAPPRGSPWLMAIGSAVVIWIGFVLPALAVTLRYRGLAWRAVALDAGHWLAVMVTQAAVLRAIGVVAPPG